MHRIISGRMACDMSIQVPGPGHLAGPTVPVFAVSRDLGRELCCNTCPYLGLLPAPGAL